MDIHIDVSADEDARFGLYAAAGYELTVGGLSINMRAEQFQQLCDNLRPWVVDATPPAGLARRWPVVCFFVMVARRTGSTGLRTAT